MKKTGKSTMNITKHGLKAPAAGVAKFGPGTKPKGYGTRKPKGKEAG